MGDKLKLPLETYKVEEQTTSIYASEVVKINGEIHKVRRKPFYVNEEGQEVDVDTTQILKQYEKDDGSIALFTKEEQSQLLKRGSSQEWIATTIVNKSIFNELSFQKDSVVAGIQINKKAIVNQKNKKFFAMLKVGLGDDKAIITQILWKNCEYPVAISNYKDKLLIRFLHYSEEIRDLSSEDQLPTLTQEEQDQARAFILQFHKKDFDLNKFENKTESQIMELINSRGQEIKEIKPEELMIPEDENPFV